MMIITTKENIIDALANIANDIMKIDGDRDYMNNSNLKCEYTQQLAIFLRNVAMYIGDKVK